MPPQKRREAISPSFKLTNRTSPFPHSGDKRTRDEKNQKCYFSAFFPSTSQEEKFLRKKLKLKRHRECICRVYEPIRMPQRLWKVQKGKFKEDISALKSTSLSCKSLITVRNWEKQGKIPKVCYFQTARTQKIFQNFLCKEKK